MSLKIELFPQKATGTGRDGLRRDDYATDDAFLEAAARRQMELDNPAYIKARTKVLRAYQEQLQMEAKARSEEELTTRAKHDAVMGERINAALRGTR